MLFNKFDLLSFETVTKQPSREEYNSFKGHYMLQTAATAAVISAEIIVNESVNDYSRATEFSADQITTNRQHGT